MMSQPGQRPERKPSPGWAGAALAAITVAGAFLRFRGLGVASLGLEEAASWALARMPAADLLAPGGSGGVPLYALLLGAWMRLLGDSEAALRSLSALTGVLAVPALGFLARAVYGWRAGLLSAALLAFSPIHLRYSQQTQPYALAMLFGVLSAYCLIPALHSGRGRWWAGAALCGALAFYTHAGAALFLAFEAIFVLWCRREPRALGGAALLAALCLPGALALLAPHPAGALSTGAGRAGITRDALLALPGSLYGAPISPEAAVPVNAGLGLLLLAAVAVPLAATLKQARAHPDLSHIRVRFALLYLLAPVALWALAACMGPAWNEGSLLVALPGYALLVAWVLATMPKLRLPVGAAVATLCAVGIGYGNGAARPGADWRGATAAMRAAAGADARAAVLVARPGMGAAISFYWREGPQRTGFPTHPAPLIPRADAPWPARGLDAGVFVLYGGAGEDDPDLLMARYFAGRLRPARVRVFDGVRVFAFGKVAGRFGGAPVDAAAFEGLRRLESE